MKIFISWSGRQSEAIGEAFRHWLPDVLQFTEPYFSPADIDKGARWNAEISRELELSRVGLICLTATNLNAPWLMFEAGAISKAFEGSRLCPILFGVDVTQVTGPLVHFQATPYSEKEIFKFVTTINSEAGEDALTELKLERAFNQWWPQLDEKIKAILDATPDQPAQKIRTQAEISEETLTLVRALVARDEGHDESHDGSHWAMLWDAAIKYGYQTLKIAKLADQAAQYEQLILAKDLIRFVGNLCSPKLKTTTNYDKRHSVMNKVIKDLEQKIFEMHIFFGSGVDMEEVPF